jgi:two-component system, LytTR family, sensor kinase
MLLASRLSSNRAAAARLPTVSLVWLIAGGWAAVTGLSFAIAYLTGAAPLPSELPWGALLSMGTVSLGLWIGATVAAFWVARQLTAERYTTATNLSAELLTGLVFVLVAAIAERWIAERLLTPEEGPLITSLLPRLDARVLGYVLIVALAQISRYLALSQRREVEAAGLEASLAKTKLQVLKMQLQPHFLFNTLNTTAELVHADPAAADLMITRLGDFLRLSLDHAGHQLVPFSQEIDFIRAYVDIEQVRWGDRLLVEWDCTPDTLDAAVPTLVWQPVLENAIRHGRDPVSGQARIHLKARRRGEDLLLSIRDWGPGLPAGGPVERLGLRNTRERVARLYGARATFALSDAPGGGVLASLRIPYTSCTAAHTPVPLRAGFPEPA